MRSLSNSTAAFGTPLQGLRRSMQATWASARKARSSPGFNIAGLSALTVVHTQDSRKNEAYE